MNLESDMQQNIQTELDFSSEPTGEARQAAVRVNNFETVGMGV